MVWLRPAAVFAVLGVVLVASAPVNAARAPAGRTTLKVHHPILMGPPRPVGGQARPQVPFVPGTVRGYIPCDLRNAYRVPSSGTPDGTGITIAIVDASDRVALNLPTTILSDLQAFDAQFGLADPTFNEVKLPLVNGSGSHSAAQDQTWSIEIGLDVEWAHAMAPGAAITLIETGGDSISSPPGVPDDLTAGVRMAAGPSVNADVVTMSWGIPESVFRNASLEAAFNSYFVANNAAGRPITWLASSGDFGFGPSWPAISNSVVGVGGTSLAPQAFGYLSVPGTHTDCTGATGSKGVTPANETVWGDQANSSCPNGICGTGGGPSGFETAPGWQSIAMSSNRTSPDVAMDADPASGVAEVESTQCGGWCNAPIGGTSLSSPMWAGLVARLDQERLGKGASNLGVNGSESWPYSLPANDFNDIVSGSSPASTSDPCVLTGACVAHAGYDQVTGRGSPIWPVLLNDLGGAGDTTVGPRGNFNSLPPTRILDTRTPIGGHQAPFGQGETFTLQVSGNNGVPVGAAAIATNVTVTNTSRFDGYVELWPCGTPRPLASTLNFVRDQTVAILTQVGLGQGGCLNIFSLVGPKDVILDLQGYFTPTPSGSPGGFVPLSTPFRVLDTRNSPGPLQGNQPGLELQVAGTSTPAVPADAGAVVMNLTAVDGSAALSYLSVYPAIAGPAPCPANHTNSNLNFPASRALANRVTVNVGAGGNVCVYNNSGTADAVLDLIGFYTGAGESGLLFTPFTPTRLWDSRIQGTLSGSGCPKADATLQVPLPVTVVSMNLTGLDATVPTYLEVFPAGSPPSGAGTSDVNLVPGDIRPNLVITKLDQAGGSMAICNFQGLADYVIDMNGGYS
jgi:hypothetical protein